MKLISSVCLSINKFFKEWHLSQCSQVSWCFCQQFLPEKLKEKEIFPNGSKGKLHQMRVYIYNQGFTKKIEVLYNHRITPKEYSWVVNRDCESSRSNKKTVFKVINLKLISSSLVCCNGNIWTYYLK